MSLKAAGENALTQRRSVNIQSNLERPRLCDAARPIQLQMAIGAAAPSRRLGRGVDVLSLTRASLVKNCKIHASLPSNAFLTRGEIQRIAENGGVISHCSSPDGRRALPWPSGPAHILYF